MDIRKVKKLIELLETSSVDEIEIHEGEGSVRVTRHRDPPAAPVHHYHAARPPRAPAACTRWREAWRRASARSPGPRRRAIPPGYVVISPMVGMFYQASSPGSKPFVTIGQRVAPGR